MADHSRLGRGLAALMGDVGEETSVADTGRKPRRAPIENLRPNPRNPRRLFTEAELDELSYSIRERGIIQPIVVRALQGDNFEIIAGERRWRAAQRAGLHDVPVAIIEANDAQSLEFAIIENVQRADLNPIEEAQAYARLANEFGMRQEDIAQKVGKSRASIANSMRLLDLDGQVQTWVVQGLLSVGHAKVLLGLKAHDEQRVIAETVLRQSSTVRTTERMVARRLGQHGGTRRRRRAEAVSSAGLSDLENRLQQHLATRVTIHHGEKRGRIEIEFYGNDDLQRVLGVLGLPPDA